MAKLRKRTEHVRHVRAYAMYHNCTRGNIQRNHGIAFMLILQAQSRTKCCWWTWMHTVTDSNSKWPEVASWNLPQLTRQLRSWEKCSVDLDHLFSLSQTMALNLFHMRWPRFYWQMGSAHQIFALPSCNKWASRKVRSDHETCFESFNWARYISSTPS